MSKDKNKLQTNAISRYFSEIDLAIQIDFKDNKSEGLIIKPNDEVIVRTYSNGIIHYSIEIVDTIEQTEDEQYVVTTSSGIFDEFGTWIENKEDGKHPLTIHDSEELNYEDTKVLLPMNEYTLLGCGWTVLKNRLQSFLQGGYYNDERYSSEAEQNFYSRYLITDFPSAYLELLGNLLKPYIHNKTKNFTLQFGNKEQIIELFKEVQYNEVNIVTMENIVRTIEEAFRSLFSMNNLSENQGKRKKGKVTKDSMTEAQPSYVDKIKREVSFMLYTKQFKVFQHSNLQPLSLSLIEYLHEYGFEQITIQESFNRVYNRKEQAFVVESTYVEIWQKGVHELQFHSNKDGELTQMVHQSSRKTYVDSEINLKLRPIPVNEIQDYIAQNFKPLKKAYREQVNVEK